MSKYVIAGKSDCPFYARAELLADELNLRLPDFSVHKIVVDPSEWDHWVMTMCEEKGWIYNGLSPLIWRELINRGGKGILLGSCNEFLEMAKGYYGITCEKLTEELMSVADENKGTKEFDDALEQEKLAASNPYKITITNSDTDLAYNILPHICDGGILDDIKKEMSLTLLYNSNNESNLEFVHGIKMEVEDLAQGQLKDVTTTSDENNAFNMADIIIFLIPTKELGKDILLKFKKYANIINKKAKKSTKILFAGEHAMISCYIISKIATEIPAENFLAVSRFEENKIKSLIGKKLEIKSAGITNLVIWGSSQEFIVDYENCNAYGYNGAIWAPHLNEFSHAVREIVYDKNFLDTELPQALNSNEKSEITKNALSFSAAVVSQLRDLLLQKASSPMFSLGLVSKGWYDVPEGIVYSFPVTCNNGIVDVKLGLDISESTREKIKTSAYKLEEHCKNLLETLEQ